MPNIYLYLALLIVMRLGQDGARAYVVLECARWTSEAFPMRWIRDSMQKVGTSLIVSLSYE